MTVHYRKQLSSFPQKSYLRWETHLKCLCPKEINLYCNALCTGKKEKHIRKSIPLIIHAKIRD